jgi:hypothetical protein
MKRIRPGLAIPLLLVLASVSCQEGVVMSREGSAVLRPEPTPALELPNYDYLFAIDAFIGDAEDRVQVTVKSCFERGTSSPICEDGDSPLTGVPVNVVYVCKTEEGAFQGLTNPLRVGDELVRQNLFTDSEGVLTMPDFTDEDCLVGTLDQVLVFPASKEGRMITGEHIITEDKAVLAESELQAPSGVRQEWHIKFSIRNPEL